MKYQRRWEMIIVGALLVAAILPPGQVLAETVATEKTTAEKPTKVAAVNGTVISYSDYARQLEIMKQRVLKGRPDKLPEPLMQRIQTQVIQQMVAEELLFQESRKKGIKIDPKMVEAEFMNMKQRFGTEEQYQKTLKLMNITEEKLKGQIDHQAAIRKLVETEISSKVEVSEEDTKKYFEENAGKFRKPERVRARHILIKVAKEDDDRKKALARQKLEDIKKKIMGGEDFGELAQKHSEGPSNTRGGDLGYFTRGRMVKSFEDVAFKLAPSEVSDIVETRFGYHLIKVEEQQKAKDPGYDEIKRKIADVLRRERVQKLLEPYVAKLKEQAEIETFLK